MTINTRSTKVIPVPDKVLNKIVLIIDIENKWKTLEKKLDVLINKNKWLELNDAKYYFIAEDGVVLINPKKVKLDAAKFVTLEGLNWGQMKHRIAKKWFYEQKSINPMISNNKIEYVSINNCQYSCRYIYCSDISAHMCIENAQTGDWLMGDSDGIKIPIYELNETEKAHLLYFLVSNKLNLFREKEIKELFEFFIQLNEVGLLVQSEDKTTFKVGDDDNYKLICNLLHESGINLETDRTNDIQELLDESYCVDEAMFREIARSLLDCDKTRVNMETYPEHILKDPESGHWELWGNGNCDVYAKIPTTLVARNPVFDALENKSGVVGIDFGTKSTVVTYRQSRADVLPMRIGSGKFARAVSKNDYENPTVMELRNIKKFMADYSQYEGRPNTSWEDLLISHEAAEQLRSEQSKGDTFATFFSELKQWASDKTRQVCLRDLQGSEVNIPSYLSLSDDDFDPIEIYAYYLGLFINNMVHKIYLRYKLSFPATVEKKVRDKILRSFTKGIRKSLPVQVLNDESCMKIFKVEQGASEPAAYAITALYGYGFEPEDDDKYYYGIFDFGGGTTDFDFGVWSSEEKEPENYDYQISHFGHGGDPYLGGENLLEILSYHVFLKNYDKLLHDKIVFVRPFGEKEIVGKDYLVCQDSQYAHFNLKRMMEKLRGVWEGDTETKELLKSGSILLPLFTMDGKVMDNYSIEVDLNELEQLLENRIEKGVSQFFDALKNCFGVDKNQKDIHDVEEIHIFLAGNSSKSPILYKIFKKYIDAYKKGLKESKVKETEWFKLYPPLGTDVAEEILAGTLKPNVDDIVDYINKKTEISKAGESVGEHLDNEFKKFDVNSLNKPTGKTGVAYGLLNNRVRVVQNENEEIGFRYYIGQNRKNKFYCVIDKDVHKYHTWIRFCTASREDFDIWFTRSAAAPTNKMMIDQIGVYSETGFVSEPSTEKSVYIRLVSPTEIEYVIADETEINTSSFNTELIERISLQEKQ